MDCDVASKTPFCLMMMMIIKRYGSSTVPFAIRLSSTTPTMLKTGDILEYKRIFSNQDVIEYSKVSQDVNPLHFDAEIAHNAGFQDPLVHGMLVASLFPRVIAFHCPGAVYVSQSLNFRAPVYVGDEVVGQVEAVSIRKNKTRYIAKFSTKCFKDDKIVIDGEALAVLPSLAVQNMCSAAS